MKHARIIWKAALLLALALGDSRARAQAPLTLTGVADRSVTADLVTFQVPSSNGYSYSVTLDGAPVPTDTSLRVTNADYHEARIWRTNSLSGAISNSLTRFIVRSSERKDSEWGLRPWVPYPPINAAAAELAGARLRIMTPRDYPTGLEIPVVAWIENDAGQTVRAHAQLAAPGYPTIPMLRGSGSGFLGSNYPAGPLAYAPSVPGIQTNKTINLADAADWTQTSGTLAGAVVWPAGAHIAVTTNLIIPAGASLTIGEGAVVRLSYKVNITVSGALLINGTEENPVVFTPLNRSLPWGGFFMQENTGSIDANGAIFVASGADPSAGAGHRSEQCLFFLDKRPRLALTNCAAMYMAGQFGHCSAAMTNSSDPAWTVVNIVHTLVQRCITGGEWNGCNLKFLNSALVEVPYVTPVFADDDEDGIYFMYGEYQLRDSVIGWSRDDCVDAGSGNGGSVTASNMWVDSTFHEGFAWSGGGGTSGTRRGTNDHCVAINCGQGYECGWSAGGVSYSPDVFIHDSLAVGNLNGLRFGDNYNWSYYGFARATNSMFLNNEHDTWGFNWQTDSGGWIYRTANMDVQGGFLTAASPYHPNNTVWDPARDGWRLAELMPTPPGAAVGIALASWSNSLPMTQIFDGAPVGLSTFTTNFPATGYAFLNAAGAVLCEGTLVFSPGQTIRRAYPLGFDVAAQSVVRFVLRDPVQGEFTGPTNLTFSGVIAAPQISCWAASSTLNSKRLGEGMLVRLSAPSILPVSVRYTYVGDDDALDGGTLTFAPGQIVAQVTPNPVVFGDFLLTQLVLSAPVNGALSGLTTINYGTPPIEAAFQTAQTQLDLAAFSSGLTVALNRAGSNTITASFRCEGRGGLLTNGTVVFSPGQTARPLLLPTVDPAGQDLVRVTLGPVLNAQLGSASNVFFVRTVSAPSPLLVLTNSGWRYLDTGGNPGTAWRALAYDDSSWSNGLAQLGFADNDERTPVRRYGTNGAATIAFFFRQLFTVADPSLFTNLAMTLLRDDGGVVYINGNEVYRSPSMPAPPAVITYQTLANAQGTSAPADNLVDRTNISPSVLVAGTNIAAVEIHQHRSDSSDMSFDFTLTAQPVPAAPPQQLYFGPMGAKLALAWNVPGFVLEQAESITGPWATASLSSPLMVSPTGAQQFYRLRKL